MAGTDSSVAITPAASGGAPIRVLSGLGAQGADQQVFTLADADGNLQSDFSAQVTGTLGAANATVDGATDLAQYGAKRIQVSGSFVGTITFEASTDQVTWYPVNVDVPTTGNPISTITAPGIFRGPVFARYFRARMSAYTSGTATVIVTYSMAVAPVQGIYRLSLVSEIQPGTSGNDLGKQRGNSVGSSDVGVAHMAMRAPTSAQTQGSAGGYTVPLVDQEGKTLVAGAPADGALTFQANNTLTSTTAATARASAGTGIRTYVTDISISNSAAAGTVVQILDGSTVIWQQYVAAGGSVRQALRTPLRGSTATALNVNLGTAVSSVYVSLGGYSGI